MTINNETVTGSDSSDDRNHSSNNTIRKRVYELCAYFCFFLFAIPADNKKNWWNDWIGAANLTLKTFDFN